MQALKKEKKIIKKISKKTKNEKITEKNVNPNVEKIHARDLELAPDAPKAPNEPMAIDPNSKVNQGDMAGDGNDAKGKSKSKVDPAIFRMAEERDY